MVSFPALGIARALASLDGQVCVPFHGDGLIEQVLQQVAVPFHDPLVGTGDRGQGPRFGDAQNQSIIPAARPLQHGPTAAAATQHWHAVVSAGFQVGLDGSLLAVSQNDTGARRFPEPKGLTAFARLCSLEKCFVPSQRFGGRIEIGSLEPFHGVGFSRP